MPVATLREFLQVSEKSNHVTVRNRALRAGMGIDWVERTSAHLPTVTPNGHWLSTVDLFAEIENRTPWGSSQTCSVASPKIPAKSG